MSMVQLEQVVAVAVAAAAVVVVVTAAVLEEAAVAVALAGLPLHTREYACQQHATQIVKSRDGRADDWPFLSATAALSCDIWSCVSLPFEARCITCCSNGFCAVLLLPPCPE